MLKPNIIKESGKKSKIQLKPGTYQELTDTEEILLQFLEFLESKLPA